MTRNGRISNSFFARTYLHASSWDSPQLTLILIKALFMGNCSSSFETIWRWMRCFSYWCRSFEDEESFGGPPTVVDRDTVASCWSLVEADPRTPILYLFSDWDLSAATTHSLLHVYLCSRKICTRWVPHGLSDQEKATRVEIRVTQTFLEEYKINLPFPFTLFP